MYYWYLRGGILGACITGVLLLVCYYCVFFTTRYLLLVLYYCGFYCCGIRGVLLGYVLLQVLVLVLLLGITGATTAVLLYY